MQTSTLAIAVSLFSITTAARADDAADFEKSSQFVAALQDSIDLIAESCKAQLSVTTNIAAADLTPWDSVAKGGPPSGRMRRIAQGCTRAIGSILEMCRSNANKDRCKRVLWSWIELSLRRKPESLGLAAGRRLPLSS